MGVQIPDGMPAPPESPTALGAVAPKTEVFLCDGAAVQKTPLPQCPSHAEDSNADGFSGAGTVNEADPEKLAGGADLPEEASPAVGTEVPEPPDLPTEGPAPWLVLLGGWCCLFCSFGWINCIGVFQDYYQQHQLHNYSPSAVSWIPSSEIFLMNFCGPIFGKIFDDYGTRYLLGGGSIVHVFGLMMASLSSKYYQFFLAQGFCSAVGASAVYFAAIGSVGTWFCKNRAAAYGVLASGSSLGGVLFPIIVTKLVPRAGFAWAMRAAAFLILALLIVANLTVRSRITPRLKPRFHLQDFTMPLREPVFLVLTAANLMVFLGLFLPFNYIIVEAKENGMSPSLSMYLLSMLNAVSIFGRIIPGIIADRIGCFNVMVITCFLLGALVLALWLPSHGNTPTVIFACLYGFSSGSYVSMAPALVAQISDVRQVGTRTGLVFAIAAVGALIGSPIGGMLVKGGDRAFVFLELFCGVVLLLGGCLFALCRFLQAGFRLEKI